jgi:hypothetical protein
MADFACGATFIEMAWKNRERPIVTPQPGVISYKCRIRCRPGKRRSPPARVKSAGNVECYMEGCDCQCHKTMLRSEAETKK